jgi:hypothetical protein
MAWDFLFLVKSCNLRRFNQSPEWNVHQVLSIRGFFMSAPHLTTFDKKLFLTKSCNLRRFNQTLEWDVRDSKYKKGGNKKGGEA